MDYVIKSNKGVYIRLNQNGTPVTCTKDERSVFEYHKARNVLAGLPKTMKRFHFKVEAVRDAITPPKATADTVVVKADDSSVPEEVSRWIGKFGVCDEILNEAADRYEQLRHELSEVDKQICNVAHLIEFNGKVDMYSAWSEYKKQHELFKRRRHIKDESLVLRKILNDDFRKLSKESIEKTVAGLGNRKFSLRIVEEDDDGDNGMSEV